MAILLSFCRRQGWINESTRLYGSTICRGIRGFVKHIKEEVGGHSGVTRSTIMVGSTTL